MKITAFLMLHATVAFFSIRGIYRKKQMREMVLFLLLLLFSAYVGLAELASLPQIHLVKAIDFLFSPTGKWIEHVLGS